MSNNYRKFKKILPYLLVAPLVIWIVVTIIFPAINVVIESLYNSTYVGTKEDFVGLANYVDVLKDKNYWTAWSKSAIWVIGCTLIQTILGFGTALVLNQKIKFSKYAKTWSVIPWVIPTIVVSIMWEWIFNSSYGILNAALLRFGIIEKAINFFGPEVSLYSLIFMNVWHWFPFTTIIILAGLGTIPDMLYESAMVDGAGKVQRFFNITLPGLSKITFALVVIGTLWCFNIFDMVYITTEGGPLNKTTTVPVFIYREAFKNYKLGRSSAESIITALMLIVLAVVLAKTQKPADDE